MLYDSEISKNIKNLKNIIIFIKQSINFNSKKEEVKNLKSLTEKSNFWSNKDNAINITKLINEYEDAINSIQHLESALYEIEELFNLFNQNSNEYEELITNYLKLKNKIMKKKIECMFKNNIDKNNCFIDINPGAGGTESQDWVYMISNIYIKWAEKNKYNYKIINKINGDEAGFKTISIKIINNKDAKYAYGLLKFETGIHRLVRISPFNSNSKRHTSFASVSVYPEIEIDINIKIEEKDIRIDTYRASGAGGQHVNTTDSAIRITHIPTGVVVQCQNERSQHKNKSEAIKMLKSKLYQLEQNKIKEQKNIDHQNKQNISWGNQKRSYVLHPYKLIKDLITLKETSNSKDFLEGNINDFLYSSVEFNSIHNNK